MQANKFGSGITFIFCSHLIKRTRENIIVPLTSNRGKRRTAIAVNA
jgi:hypothetical protein